MRRFSRSYAHCRRYPQELKACAWLTKKQGDCPAFESLIWNSHLLLDEMNRRAQPRPRSDAPSSAIVEPPSGTDVELAVELHENWVVLFALSALNDHSPGVDS
jgi:hypothetical protein